MENFIVSARKYRPATFDTVVGQQSITNTLKNAISTNHLAQAYLFTGPRGVGKTTTARIFAKTINCMNLDVANTEACNECESCKSFATNSSFNIYELDAASNNSVDDIRQLVEQVRIPPQVGKYKIYIIDEVHMLSTQAFNAFLKTLEEPPTYVKFILATTERHKIIPTILSRCQVFNFNRITISDMAKHLAYVAKNEGVTAEEDALHLVAEKADGALRDALSIFDQLVSFTSGHLTYEKVVENLHVLDQDYFFKITDEILKGNISSALVLLNQIIDKGFDGQHFIIGLGEHLRSLMISRDEATIDLMDTSNNIKEKYRQQAPQFETGFLIRCLEINNQSDINYRTSNNKRLLLELGLMQMCGLASGMFDKTGAEKKRIDLKKNEVPESLLTDKQDFADTLLSPNINTNVPSPENTSVSSPQKTEEKAIEPSPIPRADSQENTGPTTKPSTKEDKPKPLKRKINRGFSRDLGYSLNDEKKEADAEEDPIAYMIGKEHIAEPIEKDKLDEIINSFINELEGQPSLKSVLRSEKPALINDKEIEFKFYNKAQEQDLMSHAEVLLMKLRTQLNNYQIKIKTSILATENFKADGPMEKFEQMAKKNPNLRKLKDVLKLEIEF
ncbi:MULTISPECIES: DNA polymerase III subunit gamma/tau [unclassified Lentimicrobium]|uniref:DNA polymerase III subunit gamma/tau n=1 Tax=unclassified Lentimicrobium TaxID=2677434 RepID=UPI001555F3D0|nr:MULTISPECIES: DNA polymerase III subunit gamma/tau [unclassified Lentimicrobium]NPD46449.1 DNA polymerase III subunit gamma/tau [Lentimicrobium sp. S6]NPD84910.1 DNA polymerase III subunit gamma/tau [Lentimicrobium sp. L6]